MLGDVFAFDALSGLDDPRFARRTSRMGASAIREILKVTQQPDVISFAGGLPAPELFPIEAIIEDTKRALDRFGPAALQYTVTEGLPELRAWVAERVNATSQTRFAQRDVLITGGSQQALDLVGKVFIDPGDTIVLENPSYLGAIQAFDAYEPRYLTVATDEHGLVPDALQSAFEYERPRPKFLYLIPNFQNPTGVTLAAERREAIVRICERYGVAIVEDDPYGELRFDGERAPALASYDGEGTIVYLGTGSKICAPGLRVAWALTRDDELRAKLVHAKQGADLHTATFTQAVFLEHVGDVARLDAHVRRLCEIYGQRRDTMREALERTMPEAVSWNIPAGGMFFWATIAGDVDTERLFTLAAAKRVAFVPGRSFFPHRDRNDGLRLNFSNAREDAIRAGIERLASAIRDY